MARWRILSMRVILNSMEKQCRATSSMAALLLVVSSCAPATRKFPWPLTETGLRPNHAEVETLNSGYDRVRSNLLVRRVKIPTRANLDYAAYHANVMIFDPPPEAEPDAVDAGEPLDRSDLFGGFLDLSSVTPTIGGTTLTEHERSHPMAFSPLVDALAKWNYRLSGDIEDLRGAVRVESWGGGGGPHIVRQRATEIYLHRTESDATELWVKIEFQPWFRELAPMPDEDGDGFPEIYARAREGLLSGDALAFVRDDYAGKKLDAKQVDAWANELGSYWYPSYNTDLVEAGERWPDETVEASIRKELSGKSFENPTVVMLGKPQGVPIYNLFLIDQIRIAGARAESAATAHSIGGHAVTPETTAAVNQIRSELREHGDSWKKWSAEVEPFHRKLRAELDARDPSLKGFIGRDGFLFYRASLEQMLGGDFRAQAVGKNPFPVIVEFSKTLEAHGVDFLFVPVPTKAAVFADKLQSGDSSLAGKIVTPYERKLLMELAEAGVEVVDLLPLFLNERTRALLREPPYLLQDTHWTDTGLQIAALAIADRVKRYPWYESLVQKPTSYGAKAAAFTHRGDLPSRLTDPEQSRFKPLELFGTQVITPEGELYDDDPDSPITILGDSFTGVYQRTFCRHAGLSAQLARALSHPVDLVMSYGGGPNVRKKILRRGDDAFKNEMLVIWVMAARDLYNYWEDWELLSSK